ncbi:MAG: ATP-binding protein [Acutalibacteraceae bacterium]|nr:ATP-binding protein [Acutalibacteraceae bacterium]
MKELSLNILDIVENSIKAGADLIKITLIEDGDKLTVAVYDNGSGMDDKVLKTALCSSAEPDFKGGGGMGIPLFKKTAERTGGSFGIKSKVADNQSSEHGTVVTAVLFKSSPDFKNLGNIPDTVEAIIAGNPEGDLIFSHKSQNGEVFLNTKELRKVLKDVPLNNCEVLSWIKTYLEKQYRVFNA